ncbi:MAG: lipoprotein, partial [Anaerolineae bacterium]
MRHRRVERVRKLLVLSLLVLTLAACGRSGPGPTPVPEATLSLATVPAAPGSQATVAAPTPT